MTLDGAGQVLKKLCASDVAFGCTDDNAGRLVLSLLSTYLLTPVIDLGVLLSSDQIGRLSEIDGRVTTLTSGAGYCHQSFQPSRMGVGWSRIWR